MAVSMASSVPVLSFPAILRNPGLNSRFAHLHGSPQSDDVPSQHRAQLKKHLKEEQREGKRWLRRKDNATFVGNPHIVAASKQDYAILVPQAQATFPEPLPAYLPRTVKLPPTEIPPVNMASANAGRFSVSLRGMRRDLRRAGGRAERLITDIETALVEWLLQGGTVLRPNNTVGNGLQFTGRLIGNSGTIVEVSRTPLQLIWRIPDDAFARYVVHCCARYHEVVSFSKGTNESRLTYLLRPNVMRPDRRTQAALETPPVTDLDYSSNPDTDIDPDFVSDQELESSIEPDHNASLPAITEMPSLPAVREDDWSLVADGELHGFGSDSEVGSSVESSVDILLPRLDRLSVDSLVDSNAATHPITLQEHIVSEEHSQVATNPNDILSLRPQPTQSSTRRGEWTSARSVSSPSRSPVRIRRRRRPGNTKRTAIGLQDTKRSFYDYLFQ